jgi:futalosine hydrolase
MTSTLAALIGTKQVLLVFATPMEARGALVPAGLARAAVIDAAEPWTRVQIGPGLDLAISGVGKANAAGCVARVADPARHALIVSAGIAGWLALRETPATIAPPLGTTIIADRCTFADEGIETPSRYLSLDRAGFPPRVKGTSTDSQTRWSEMSYRVDPRFIEATISALGSEVPWLVGGVATVSTCSGTDARVAEMCTRTEAIAEAMEGAAVALVGDMLGIPVAEIRCISNTTGDRDRQEWDIRLALQQLSRVLGPLFAF